MVGDRVTVEVFWGFLRFGVRGAGQDLVPRFTFCRVAAHIVRLAVLEPGDNMIGGCIFRCILL